MKKYIYAQPYVGIYGRVDVPDDIKEEEIERYINCHFEDIVWDYENANYDFAGVDLDIG